MDDEQLSNSMSNLSLSSSQVTPAMVNNPEMDPEEPSVEDGDQNEDIIW